MSDLVIGDNVTVGHGSVLHGAKIGNNVLIGMHTTLGIFSEIGDDCMIGAHSMVKDYFKVPSKSLVVGVPARIKRAVSRKEIERILIASTFYVELSKDFKKRGL
jgi:carbonic anhydrase/acetyltransferase-like protein (isoleucine patch superfamily)